MQRSKINLFFLKLAQWGMRLRIEVAVAKIFRELHKAQMEHTAMSKNSFNSVSEWALDRSD